MRSLRLLVGIVGAAALLAACSSPGTIWPRATAASDGTSNAGTASAPIVPSISISLSLPSSASSPGTVPPQAPATAAIDVRQVADAAAFATPSGRIVCVMADNSVRCDYIAGDKAWTSPQPKACQLAWGDSLQLTQTAGSTCHGDTLADSPSLDSGLVGWRRSGDPTVEVNGLALAALPYGSGIALGTLECDVASTGVTCTNTGTGHGFTIAREAYTIF